jgi:hypothetical protein
LYSVGSGGGGSREGACHPSDICSCRFRAGEKRPEGTENRNLPTGEVELYVDSLEILNVASPLPFPMEEAAEHRSSFA